MVDFKEVTKGTKLKIIDSWVYGCNQNLDGLMDIWLGAEVTVDGYWNTGSVLIEEDEGEWAWNEKCFEYIVEDSDFEVYEVDFSMLLGGV